MPKQFFKKVLALII